MKKEEMSERVILFFARLLKNLPITKKKKKETLCWWTKKTGKERKWQIFPKELFDMLTKEMLKICSMLLMLRRRRRDFTAKHFFLVEEMVLVQKTSRSNRTFKYKKGCICWWRHNWSKSSCYYFGHPRLQCCWQQNWHQPWLQLQPPK